MIEKKRDFPSIFPQKGKLLQNFEKKKFFWTGRTCFFDFLMEWRALIGRVAVTARRWLANPQRANFLPPRLHVARENDFLDFFFTERESNPPQRKNENYWKIQSKYRMVGLCRGWTRVWVNWQESGVFCYPENFLEKVNFLWKSANFDIFEVEVMIWSCKNPISVKFGVL